MQPLPHMHVLQNQDFSSSLVQTWWTWGITKPFSYRYWLIFYDMIIGSNEVVISYNFLILVTSKPRFSSSLPQTQRTWGITKPFSYRYWLFFTIRLLEAMRKWYHTTSSYWWPQNQGFSSSLPQTQRTWWITKPFSYRYWLFFMIWLLEAMKKWYHTTSSYWWPPNQGFSSSLPQTQRSWGITKPFSYRYWLFFMIWLLWALMKRYYATSS